jgi:hypothetical protein
MRSDRSITAALVAAVLVAAAPVAIATVATFATVRAEEAAPKPRPYKPIAVELPQPYKDPSFTAFLKQLAGIAERKDRAALAKLVAANFFWTTDDGKDIADKARSASDNLASALYLDNPDTEGWDILAAFATEVTADPSPQRKGVICGPGEPKFDSDAATELGNQTGTTSASWYYPVSEGVVVRSALAQKSAPIGKLGMHLVWIYPDESPAGVVNADTVRIVLPSGQFGYVAADALMPLPGDLMCYLKEGDAWKIAGYFGGLPPAN